MNKEAATVTIERIQNALKEKEAATVTRVITLIHELAEKAFIISTGELAELITSDVMVTKKIIETANKLAFNQSGSVVTTVSQAIGLIGFAKVRNLAMSLLLVENSENSMNLTEQREVSAFALCSGLLSQAVIEMEDSELAEQSFICTTLRNYGKLLISTFMIEDFREAQLFAAESSEDEAFTKVFGLTPLELSYFLLESSRMPDDITACLKNVPKHVIRRASRNEIEKISVVADFSMKLCDMAMFSDLPNDAFNQESKSLLGIYSKHIDLPPETIFDLLKSVNDRVNNFCTEYEINIVPESISSRMLDRANKKTPPKRENRAALLKKKQEVKKSAMLVAIEKLRVMIADPPIDTPRAFMITLEALVEDQNLDDCIMFRRKTGTESFFQTAGVGKLFYATRKQVVVKHSTKDLFGLAISRKQDVLFGSAADKKVQSYLPDWLRNFRPIRALYVLPIALDDECQAIILGVSWSGYFMNLEGARLAELRKVRDTVAEIMESTSFVSSSRSGGGTVF
ncbi:MAG: HDOD domain-containing protein [Verrucomicrobiota bacterium]